ncbi:TVP38/TMEM64 family protein [Maritimibacter dapengensis]|uniref:TVP38/TMEM64 family membrane protein n=1 Tax=Maritimibacter dapengensis TaxID=2836868 RepID=A0ABS6T5R8_9RHOB|nr:VTT domain-containing protein [Maritimibacter dapengensis]MBV7380575.1 VTT domain-containing protein [Maritimibacter dapengensis]
MRADRIKRLAPIAVILLVAVVGIVFLRDRLSFETLAANREALIAHRDANYVLSAMVFVVAYIAIVGFSLPGATIATLTGGFLFGIFPGVLFNLAGATIGATIIFLAARFGLGERLAARMEAVEGRIARLKRGIDENQWSVLFLMRLLPAVPFFVANVVPALLNVRTGVFVVTTVVGIIPGALVYTSVGAGLGDVFDRGGAPDLGVIFEPYILGPIIGLCVLAALPILIRTFRKGDVA